MQKVLRALAIFLLFSSIGGCIFSIITVSSNQTSSNDKIMWMIQFAKVMIQDFLITPLIFVFNQVIIVTIYKTQCLKRKKLLRKTVKALILPNTAYIMSKRYKNLFKDPHNSTKKIKRLSIKLKALDYIGNKFKTLNL